MSCRDRVGAKAGSGQVDTDFCHLTVPYKYILISTASGSTKPPLTKVLTPPFLHEARRRSSLKRGAS
jgi:hypothetical protein